MKLLIDIGNTSAKIAVSSEGSIIHFERLTEDWDKAFQRLTMLYGKMDSVRIATVAGKDEALLKALDALGTRVLWLTADVPCPVKPVFNIPKGLGADRWAADIGALSIDAEHTLLMIDAGTCITYDMIGRDGNFLGGVISPGVQLRLDAMHEHTALLPQLEATTEADMMGHDTRTAMLSAAVNGARLEMEGYIRHLLKDYPDLHVFITGGNTFAFSPDITCTITYDPYLVFRGLEAIKEEMSFE